MSDLWISHSSINDFLKCPRLYYLRNVYKNPQTKNKINIINPALALGNVVHDVLDIVAKLPVEERLKVDLLAEFETEWQKFTGKKGGFNSESQELEYKARGQKMIQTVLDNPAILKSKAIRLKSPDSLPPRYYISEVDKILLCGKVDWLEYLESDDSLHIIDFKTGKHEEDPSSMQLAIYCLLVKNLQKRQVSKVSYWYLDKDKEPVEQVLPDYEAVVEHLLDLAGRIKFVREKKLYDCPKNGCFSCSPFEAIIDGEAEFVGTSGYQDIYIIN